MAFEKQRILVTGPTGNVGTEVINYLLNSDRGISVVAGVRDTKKASKQFNLVKKPDFVSFDFDEPDTWGKSLENINMVFLLRPPHISDVDKVFRPLISTIREKGVSRILFLSVQGAEKSSIIPHNKIEKLIRQSGLDYIFLRPGYFMQNLTTTLLGDIREKRKIILPAGNAKFNWIDVRNIGEAAAILLMNFDSYKNQAYELTGYQNKSFHTVEKLLNEVIGPPVKYENVSPMKFYRIKRKQDLPAGLIVVMIVLHFLPRFQKEPRISNMYEELTGKKPTLLQEFISREKELFG